MNYPVSVDNEFTVSALLILFPDLISISYKTL